MEDSEKTTENFGEIGGRGVMHDAVLCEVGDISSLTADERSSLTDDLLLTADEISSLPDELRRQLDNFEWTNHLSYDVL